MTDPGTFIAGSSTGTRHILIAEVTAVVHGPSTVKPGEYSIHYSKSLQSRGQYASFDSHVLNLIRP